MTAVEPAGRHALSRSSAAVWLPSLSGLRFVAVVIVFGFHVHVANVFNSGVARTAIEWIFGPGAGGVSFFFVLSGYVLTWSAAAARHRRPVLATALRKDLPEPSGDVDRGIGRHRRSRHRRQRDGHSTQRVPRTGMDSGPRIFFGLNAVSWFLACEAFFYLLFPLLHRGLVRLPGRALWPGTIAVFATVWALPLISQLVPESARYWAIWILPVARLPEFLAGMLLARIVVEGRWLGLGVWPFAIVATSAYFASLWLPWELQLVAGTAVPLALLVGAVGAADAADRPTPWRWPWLVRMGELAFAFFLVHQLALRAVVRLAGPADSALMSMAVVVAAFCLALMGSWLLYRFVEVPGMHLLGRKHG